MSEMDRKQLASARNVRGVTPRVCATCAYGSDDGRGFFSCERQDGLQVDIEEMIHFFTVCDLYKINQHDVQYAPVEEESDDLTGTLRKSTYDFDVQL